MFRTSIRSSTRPPIRSINICQFSNKSKCKTQNKLKILKLSMPQNFRVVEYRLDEYDPPEHLMKQPLIFRDTDGKLISLTPEEVTQRRSGK
jgi:hypothetical protein